MSASERRIEELEAEVVRLRNLLGKQMRAGDQFEFEGIVNDAGEPKVTFRWDTMGAQFDVETARKIAFDIIRVAEWADSDSKIYAAAVKMDMGEQVKWALLSMVREGRGGVADASASGGV